MTKRDYLKHLVAGKNNAFRLLTEEEKALGFLGWHERGYLPHCDYPNFVQFVTFRLEDSMPASRRGEWEHLLAIEDVREKRLQLEAYLDRGRGACELRRPNVAALVEQALLHRHGEHYEMLAWVVMPNHVATQVFQRFTIFQRGVRHARSAELPLGANRDFHKAPELGAPSAFWQREYWDTYMRDSEQERKSIRYIEGNPARVKLVLDPAAWPFSSARCRDPKTWQLRLPTAGGPGSGSAS